MKKFWWLLAAALPLLVLPASSHAEYYRYTDSNGVVRFTDDPSLIPQSKEAGIKRYAEPEDTLSEEERAEKSQKPLESVAPGGRQVPKNASGADAIPDDKRRKIREYSALANRLDAKKAALGQEYATLRREADQLKQRGNSVRRPQAIRAHEAALQNLNARIARYREKREAFEREVAAANKMKSELTQ